MIVFEVLCVKVTVSLYIIKKFESFLGANSDQVQSVRFVNLRPTKVASEFLSQTDEEPPRPIRPAWGF